VGRALLCLVWRLATRLTGRATLIEAPKEPKPTGQNEMIHKRDANVPYAEPTQRTADSRDRATATAASPFFFLSP